MKRLFISIILFVMLIGCTGMNVSTTANLATDTAFVLALQNNPTYKAGVIVALQDIKVLLSNDMTYDQLIGLINEELGGKYAVFGIVLASYLEEDKPLSQTYLNMLDSYKASVVKKIDKFLLLANSL